MRKFMGKDDPVDLSKLSLHDRARLSALIERDGDDALRSHLLGVVGRSETARGARGRSREIPDRWTMIHALDRLEEAYAVLAGLPAATRPKAYGGAWPNVVQEKIPLVVQAELAASGELEVQQADKNRVRLPPTTAEITRMEEALRWPFEFLNDRPALARAISQKALWSAMRVDIKKRCNSHHIRHAEFNLFWQEGLRIITQQLIQRKVPVS
jgi:hypothetical protein